MKINQHVKQFLKCKFAIDLIAVRFITFFEQTEIIL